MRKAIQVLFLTALVAPFTLPAVPSQAQSSLPVCMDLPVSRGWNLGRGGGLGERGVKRFMQKAHRNCKCKLVTGQVHKNCRGR